MLLVTNIGQDVKTLSASPCGGLFYAYNVKQCTVEKLTMIIFLFDAGSRRAAADKRSRGRRNHGQEATLRMVGSCHRSIRSHDQWLHSVSGKNMAAKSDK